MLYCMNMWFVATEGQDNDRHAEMAENEVEVGSTEEYEWVSGSKPT